MIFPVWASTSPGPAPRSTHAAVFAGATRMGTVGKSETEMRAYNSSTKKRPPVWGRARMCVGRCSRVCVCVWKLVVRWGAGPLPTTSGLFYFGRTSTAVIFQYLYFQTQCGLRMCYGPGTRRKQGQGTNHEVRGMPGGWSPWGACCSTAKERRVCLIS